MSNNPDDGGSRPPAWWQWVIAGLIIYLLPFIAIEIVERVLKTFWLSRHIPHEAGDIMRALYPFYARFK